MWEKQKRGLTHLHGVISVESSAHPKWAEADITALRELAPRYGFGFVDGWHKVGRKFWPGVQAAAYLSSYFAGGRGHKMAITDNVLAGDLPRLGASPAEVAEQGQRDNDNDDDPKPGRQRDPFRLET